MMEAQTVSETLDYNAIPTRLIARLDIIAVGCRENFTNETYLTVMVT
jgi:hypothetical protein